MQFLVLAFAAMVAATPAMKFRRASTDICPPLDTPQCCEVDVDGILDLTCESPSGSPSSKSSFESTCASTGLSAFCCTVPVDGDALLCTSP